MAERFINPVPQFLTDNIKSLPGGQLNFFVTGAGSTRKDTFKDQAGAIANANPVLLDSSGRVPTIFLDGTYKVTLENKDGVQIWEEDPVGGDITGGALADWNETVSYSIDDLVTGSDGCRYQSITNSNLNNDPANEADPANWEKVLFIRVYNANITYVLNDAVRASNGEDYQSKTATNLNNDPITDNGQNWRLQTLRPVLQAAAKTFAARNF